LLVITGSIAAWRDSARPAPGKAAIKSLAVLPFKPLTSESRDEALELGLAETLITRLSSLRRLTVRPMSAVRKYTGAEQNPLAAGREQQVEAVLESHFQRAGDRLRVTVQFLSVRDGRPLWAEKFDEQFTDILAVEDRISARVAGALALELTGEEQQQLNKRYTANLEAYQLYLRGRFYWNQ
jgi:TolB-like protein